MSVRLSDLLADYCDGLEREPRRYPVVRSGEREPIPWIVRLSIARRDGFRCRECGREMPEMDGMELDHMLPWSAGGGDHSGNLRVLCRGCNQRRSNWDDGAHERERVPTTWWCMTCWLSPEAMDEMDDDFQAEHRDRMRRRQIWTSGIDLTAVPFVEDGPTLAYCAWCWGYSRTDLAFTPSQQAELAAHVTYREPA